MGFEQLVGPIAPRLDLDHLCKNRACVSPLHLEPVPRRVNTARGSSVVARQMRQTHCLRGHPLDAANTYPGERRRGIRRCRICHRARLRQGRARALRLAGRRPGPRPQQVE